MKPTWNECYIAIRRVVTEHETMRIHIQSIINMADDPMVEVPEWIVTVLKSALPKGGDK